MYTIDLRSISLDEFETILANTDLSPGRRILAFNASNILHRFREIGIDDLGALQQLLRNKKRYRQLADELYVSTEYLNVLNREVNAYVAKPLPLATLDVFSDGELRRLERAGIISTKMLYERCITKVARAALASDLGLDEEHLRVALEVSDLLRINGVGPVYAKMLREIGIHRTLDFCGTQSRVILEQFQELSAEQNHTNLKLSLKDVEYCKRFCSTLSVELEGCGCSYN